MFLWLTKTQLAEFMILSISLKEDGRMLDGPARIGHNDLEQTLSPSVYATGLLLLHLQRLPV
jgi:hypothetical protein